MEVCLDHMMSWLELTPLSSLPSGVRSTWLILMESAQPAPRTSVLWASLLPPKMQLDNHLSDYLKKYHLLFCTELIEKLLFF
jgi:hypothetical protein